MAVNIVNALGAGSGIDTKKLAEDLVEAERAPKKTAIEEKIAKSEARISGFAVIKFALSQLKTAFSALNDRTDFNSLTIRNSQPAAFGVTTTSAAAAGNFSVNITQVAAAQRSPSAGFAAADTQLSNAAVTLSLSVGGGTAQEITVPTTNGAVTPTGVVNAINAANKGITAQLINTGDAVNPFKIVVTGQTGASNSFTLTSSVPGLSFGTYDAEAQTNDSLQNLQGAENAIFSVNGLSVTRSANTVSDVLTGVTLELYTQTTSPARVDLARDQAALKQKLDDLVTAYNDFEEVMQVLGDRSSTVEEFGGALAGESLLSNIRSQVRSMFTNNSSTPGATIQAARNVGISIDRFGKMSLDETRFEAAVANNFDEVVQMFSANSNNQSIYSTAPGGVAGDAVNKIDAMLRSSGLIARQTESAGKQVNRQKAELERLESRMEKLLERYTRQFVAMEAVVGRSNSLRDNLTSTFEGLMAMYTKR